MNPKTLLTTIVSAALLAGSARAQVYLSSVTSGNQTINTAQTTWTQDATANWATSIGGSTYTSWPSAGTTVVGFTNLTMATSVRLDDVTNPNYAITGMELYKNQPGSNANAVTFGAAFGGRILTLNGDMDGYWNPGVASEISVTFSSTNAWLRGTYTVSNTASNNSTLVLTASGNSTVGGNITLGDKGVFSFNSNLGSSRPDLNTKLNLAGGSVRIGAAGGNQSFASGVTELKGNSTASMIYNISTMGGAGNATFQVNQDTDTTYMGTFNAKAGGSWKLDKNGNGSLTLSGNNTNITYQAKTTVAINAGSVIGANDSAFGNATLSSVTVGANGTLGVANQANLAVRNVTFSNGAVLFFDMLGAASTTDTELLTTGNQLGAADIPINLANINGLADGKYTLLNVAGTMAGNFTMGTGWGNATISSDAHNVYMLLGVPEPGTLALFGLGVSLLLVRRFKRRE